GGVKRLAGRALVVAEHFHDHGGTLRAESFVRIDVLERGSCRLRSGEGRGFRRKRRGRKNGRLLRRNWSSGGSCGYGNRAGSRRDRRRRQGLVQGRQEQSPQDEQSYANDCSQDAPTIHSILQKAILER